MKAMLWTKVKPVALAVCAAVLLGGGFAAMHLSAAAAEPAKAEPGKVPAAAFTTGPAVSGEGDKVVIAFTASRPTTATVEVLDAGGKVARHLASGLLGPKAPAPLAANALAQKLVWDGKDDKGKPAGAGCSIRVALGLTPVFDRFVVEAPVQIFSYGVQSLTCDPKGTLYVMQNYCHQQRTASPDIQSFTRDGKYERTIVPSPKKLPAGPAVGEVTTFTNILTEMRPVGLHGQKRQIMTVVGDRLFFVGGVDKIKAPGAKTEGRYLHALGLDGVPREDYFGPAQPAGTGNFATPLYLSVTPDGKTVYFAGARGDPGPKANNIHHAVYRAAWNDKDLTPWFGEVQTSGNDDAHLNEPRGLALDAKGRLYVCDWGNDRVLVLGTDKKVAARIAVASPDQVCVHPKTGAIYVLRAKGNTGGKFIVKFASVEDGAAHRAEIAMSWRGAAYAGEEMGSVLALDASDPAEPRLWMSCVSTFDKETPGHLRLVADKGDKFEPLPSPIPAYYSMGDTRISPIAVDAAREEVYVAGKVVRDILRIDGRTGKAETLEKVTKDLNGGETLFGWRVRNRLAMDLGPDGNLYIRTGKYAQPDSIRRYDREGNRVPFKVAGDEITLAAASWGGNPSCTKPSSFEVMSDGSIWAVSHSPDVKNRVVDGPNPSHNVLDVYGPDGAMAKPKFIPFLTNSVWGPRLGPDGALYFLEAIRKSGLPNPGRYGFTGSLIKCKVGAVPLIRYEDKADLPYQIRFRENRLPAADIQGLDWMYYGVSPVSFGHCHCKGGAFGVDGHGRAGVPHAVERCALVIDAAGNLLARFGEYGNRDTPCGLRSVESVALSDEAMYISDDANARVLRVRWTYDAEKKLPAP